MIKSGKVHVNQVAWGHNCEPHERISFKRHRNSRKGHPDSVLKKFFGAKMSAKEKRACDIWWLSYMLMGAQYVDLINLRKSDLDLSANVLTFYRRKTDRQEQADLISVDLNPQLLSLIEKYKSAHSDSPLLLCFWEELSEDSSQTGMKMHFNLLKRNDQNAKEIKHRLIRNKFGSRVANALSRINKRIELGPGIKVTFDSARNCIATELIKKGKLRLEEVAAMLGHRRLETTRHYINDILGNAPTTARKVSVDKIDQIYLS